MMRGAEVACSGILRQLFDAADQAGGAILF